AGQLGGLGDESDFAARLGIVRKPPEDARLAGAGSDLSEEDPDERRLAGPVGTGEAVAFASLDAQGAAAQGGLPAPGVSLDDVRELQGRDGHRERRRRSTTSEGVTGVGSS